MYLYISDVTKQQYNDYIPTSQLLFYEKQQEAYTTKCTTITTAICSIYLWTTNTNTTMMTAQDYLIKANNINKAYTNKYSTTRFTLLLENMVLSQGHLFDKYDDLLAEEIWSIQLDKFIDKVIFEFRGNGLYTLLDLMELNNYSGWLRFYISDKMMPSGSPRQDKALVKVKMTLGQLEAVTDKIIRDSQDTTPF